MSACDYVCPVLVLLACPGAGGLIPSQGDSPEVGTGFDVVLQTSIVGRAAIGEMADFMKERALIEDQYAKSLMKLSKSTFGEQEEGTLNRAWQMVKAELGERAKFHSAFANDLSQEVERPLLEYKPTLKLGGKEHVPVIEQNRKILRDLDALHEKAKSTPNPNPGTRRSTKSISMEELKNLDKKAAKKLMVDDSVRILQAYNEELSTYTDNMIQALQEMEQQEETRFDCLKKLYLRYIEVNVRVNESIAMALQKVHDSVDSMQVQADREFFIRKYGTGRVRPVERDTNMDLIREV